MGDVTEDRPDSPPLPKGSYNFNFDELDPNFDPFKSKRGLDNSPERNDKENPFQTNSKLSSSPPLPTHKPRNNVEEENPFQSRSNLGHSPPRDSSVPDSCDNDVNSVQDESEDSFKTATESPVKNTKGLKKKTKSKPSPTSSPEVPEDGDIQSAAEQDGGADPEKEIKKPPAKKTSPKKSGMRKPKAKSKFKPPPNFGAQPEGDDVVIFAPPPPGPDTVNGSDSDLTSCTQMEPAPTENHEVPPPPVSGLTVPEGVNDMIDSVHDFGAGEMPMENNEEFVPASEAFNEDAEAWDMEKMEHDDNISTGRESLSAFDPLAEQVPDKVITRRVSEAEINENHLGENEDLMLMSTPQSQKSSGSTRGVARNPAARALQEQIDGDGAPREAHIVDKMLFSPEKGDEKAESEVERMNMANKKHGAGVEGNDNIVQLVQDGDIEPGTQVLKYSQSDWNKMKQELDLDYNARILNKEREWSRKLADRDKKISYQEEQLLLLRSSNDDMKCVVAEFEKTIAQLQAEKLKSNTECQQSFDDVVKERDQALEDLQSVETAFSDLHQRYERTKGVVEGFKKNEEILKKCVQDYQQKLKAAEEKTVMVRNQAEDKLAMASEEMDKLRKSTTAEVARLEAAMRKADLKVEGLERSLEQKIKENNELTAICDELIAKVGDDS